MSQSQWLAIAGVPVLAVGALTAGQQSGLLNLRAPLVATQSSSATGEGATIAQAGDLPPRVMEHLDRGVVAVRRNSNEMLVTWRILGLDPAGIGFNLYRSFDNGQLQQLNSAPISGVSNFLDTSAARGEGTYTYVVRPVLNGVEQTESLPFAINANGPTHPIVRIPIAPPPAEGYTTSFVWVGDLDGDGEYDYVIDRKAPEVPNTNGDLGAGPQYVEAYRRDGTRLWQIDLGPGSRNIYNISPGPSTISVGMYDGVTVYDLDGDGRSEVVLKVADGVRFPDGTTFRDDDPTQQHIAVLDGMTGQPRATRQFPSFFYDQAGDFGTQLGIGYGDGTPSIYFWGRNRNTDKSFNDVFASWSWKGGSQITENWVLPLAQEGYSGGNPDGTQQEASHQMRIVDVDGDGKDEVATGNFMLNGDGTLRYILPGVNHGDRFYIGKFSPDHAGFRGYGVQQNNPSGMREYYYDATAGKVLWTVAVPGTVTDVGRGMVGDYDPRFPGYEVWAFDGLRNGESGQLVEPNTSLRPWPHNMIWWDGDILGENLNDFKIEKWDPLNPKVTGSLQRLVSMTSSTFGSPRLSGRDPMFIGDIMGDWRTEVVLMGNKWDEIVVFTTNQPTNIGLYTMAHNPAYRNHMTIKGYLQSPLTDYYLGTGMAAPPRPNIRYAGTFDLPISGGNGGRVDNMRQFTDAAGILQGNGGASDQMAGTASNDWLQGHAAWNLYNGGMGADVFMINAASARAAGASQGQNLAYQSQLAVIGDFEGAGVAGGDVLALTGFRRGSLALYQSSRTGRGSAMVYYYTVTDTAGHVYSLQVNSVSGQPLSAGDFIYR